VESGNPSNSAQLCQMDAPWEQIQDAVELRRLIDIANSNCDRMEALIFWLRDSRRYGSSRCVPAWIVKEMKSLCCERSII
jgi:hypothetical protein